MPKVSKCYKTVPRDPVGDLVLAAVKHSDMNWDDIAYECGYSCPESITKQIRKNMSSQLDRIKTYVHVLGIPEDQMLDAIGTHIYGRDHKSVKI